MVGVDPRKADQLVRGTLVLPHGIGKSKRVLVIAQGEKIKEAEELGLISWRRGHGEQDQEAGSTLTRWFRHPT